MLIKAERSFNPSAAAPAVSLMREGVKRGDFEGSGGGHAAKLIGKSARIN